MNCTIGIDIGKDTLVIHRLPDKATLEVSNDKAGLTRLLRWLSRDVNRLANLTPFRRPKLTPYAASRSGPEPTELIKEWRRVRP